mmetsp:Transcript_8191/g.17373  ORF Transcript_8191/g.17373 Transcript_8191/m.17373 type:complete len:200 (-) Transcript_8191:1975-2574(-)
MSPVSWGKIVAKAPVICRRSQATSMRPPPKALWSVQNSVRKSSMLVEGTQSSSMPLLLRAASTEAMRSSWGWARRTWGWKTSGATGVMWVFLPHMKAVLTCVIAWLCNSPALLAIIPPNLICVVIRPSTSAVTLCMVWVDSLFALVALSASRLNCIVSSRETRSTTAASVSSQSFRSSLRSSRTFSRDSRKETSAATSP